MNKERKAFWFSLFLTGAGQLYLGEKKKGWTFMGLSFLGILISVLGVVLIASSSAGLKPGRILLYLGVFLFICGLVLIIALGYRSLNDITSRYKKDKSE